MYVYMCFDIDVGMGGYLYHPFCTSSYIISFPFILGGRKEKQTEVSKLFPTGYTDSSKSFSAQ